jgi:hypothetical protein
MKQYAGKKFVIAFASTVMLVSGMASASAATQTQTLDMTSSTMPSFSTVQAGDVLTLQISGLSGSEGVYVSVCDKTVTSATKSTLCDPSQAHMAWITASGGQGSSAAASGGAITIADTFGAVDCTTVACVLYVRGDHNNPTAFQLTRKIDLTFASGGVSKIDDAVSGTAGGMTMTPNVPHDLTYRTPVTFSLTATSGLPISLESLTPDCSVVGNVVTALAGGTVCAIEATTAGNDTYSALKVNFPFYTRSLGQKVTIAWPTLTTLKSAGSVTFKRVKTNVDKYPVLTSNTPKVCKVSVVGTKWKLSAIKAGTCTVVVSSAADTSAAKRWTSLQVKRTYVLKSVGKRS